MCRNGSEGEFDSNCMNHLTSLTNQRARSEPWITQHFPEYARKGCLRKFYTIVFRLFPIKLRHQVMEKETVERKKIVSKGPIWKSSWDALKKGNLLPYLTLVDSTNMWVTKFETGYRKDDFSWYITIKTFEKYIFSYNSNFYSCFLRLRNFLEDSGTFRIFVFLQKFCSKLIFLQVLT